MLALLLQGAAPVQAQTAAPAEEFNPHWYVLPQVGVGHHRGEGKFGDLISPAAALSVGYQFNPVLGLRLGASGWESRNYVQHPSAEYKWNYLQGNLDLTVSMLNLILGQKPLRKFDVNAFVGIGADYAFNNGDAKDLYVAGQRFDKLWCNHRWSPVVRAGLGLDYRLSRRVVLGLEANTNILSDHFNSKKGVNDNRDWQSNLLLGVKIALGKTTRAKKEAPKCCDDADCICERGCGRCGGKPAHCGKPGEGCGKPGGKPGEGCGKPGDGCGKPGDGCGKCCVEGCVCKCHPAPMAPVEPVAPVAAPEPKPAELAQPTPQAVREPLRIEVFFDLNKTDIRPSEEGKLQDLAAYLSKNPSDVVRLSGYADAATGTHPINQKLSEGRADEVRLWLVNHGISSQRISTSALGDNVQPNNTPASNRVVICVTETK